MAKWFSKGWDIWMYSGFFSRNGKRCIPDNKIEKRIEKFHAGEKDLEFLLKLMKDVC